MSNKQGSSCSTPGAGTPAPAPRRLFRRSPGDVPCPPLGAGTRKPLPVSPPFMPFTVRSHDGSECRSRLGRVGPRPAHRPSRRAGSPSSPAPLAGWLSIHLPVGPGWAGERSSRSPRFGRSFKGHRPQGADAEAAAPGRAGGWPPPLPRGPGQRPLQRAPPGGSRGPKLIRLLRTGQGREHREVLLPPAAPRPPTHTHPESEHKEKHFAD